MKALRPSLGGIQHTIHGRHRYSYSYTRILHRYNKPTAFDWQAYLQEGRSSRVYFDVTVDGQEAGRVIFQLADDVCPTTGKYLVYIRVCTQCTLPSLNANAVTVSNFKRLCTGEGRFSYKGTQVHHINKKGHIMGGDVENREGRGSHSSFDEVCS
jgi:hypothetical protein